VVKLALPPLSVSVSSRIAPSKNFTWHVGVPLPGALAATVAVKVTAWPNAEGLAEELTVVVVGSALTFWPPGRLPVLSWKSPSLLR
jgi:hypothetical protein